MTFTRGFKFSTIVVFVFTVFVAAPDISKSASFDDDVLESDEGTIGKGHSKFLQKTQPKVEKIDDSNTYPRNLRYWFGKSREWSNFQHPKQLKRSGESTSSSLQFSSTNNDSLGTFTNNSLPNYHCPINLLHGNNLTVKNYFLVIPRSNDNFNDTLQRIALLGEENCEPKTIKTDEENISFKPITEVENSSPNHSLPTEYPSTQTTINASYETNNKTEETPIIRDAFLSEHVTVVLFNTSEAESTTTESTTTLSSVKEEYSLSLFGEEEKTGTASMLTEATTVGLAAVSSETHSLPTAPSTEMNEFLRTVDKYCETYNSRTSPSVSITAHGSQLLQTALYNIIPPNDQLHRLNRNSNLLKSLQQK